MFVFSRRIVGKRSSSRFEFNGLARYISSLQDDTTSVVSFDESYEESGDEGSSISAMCVVAAQKQAFVVPAPSYLEKTVWSPSEVSVT